MNREQLKGLSDIEKRIAVARDVVEAIKVKKLVAYDEWFNSLRVIDEERGLNGLYCATCAIGAPVAAMCDYNTQCIEIERIMADGPIHLAAINSMVKAGFPECYAYYLENVFEGKVAYKGDNMCHSIPDRTDRLLYLWELQASSLTGLIPDIAPDILKEIELEEESKCENNAW